MSAYTRTKLACAELTRAGASIPAWTTLRDLVGKGSANDINRAKKDFRQEHADALRKMEEFSAEGVPQVLTPHILGLWQAAIAYAQDAYAEKARVWQEQVERAAAERQHAQDELARAQAAAQALQVNVVELEQTCLALQEQVRSEQVARAQAEKMIDDIRADLVGQRDRLDAALAHAQAEMEKAINRLEAAERRAMMEIERARREAAQQVASIQTRLKSGQEKHEQETMRLSAQLQDSQDHAARLREQRVALEQENRAFAERAKRAEALTDALQAQNTALHARHAALLSAMAQAGQSHRHAAPLKKKRLRRNGLAGTGKAQS